MARHFLPEGQRWIENLLALGRALSYNVEDEYDVAPEGEEEAPVDVAWLRSTEDEFPLFIFEVESRPSGQMTYNAAKVFAQATDLFEKPLFHFHLVVSGGDTSGRLKTSQELFGTFNYRVYRVADADGCTQALCDMLSQHRRVADELDVLALAAALEPKSWPGLDLDAVWIHIETCGFRAPWEAAYAQLAVGGRAFHNRLDRRLRRVLDPAAEDPPAQQYPSWLAQQCAPVLHAALLAALDNARAEQCLASVKRWQGGPPRKLGPAYGASEALDDLVFARMPLIWAALAAAVNTAAGRSFALEQMAMSLGPSDQPNPLALSAVAAVWMLHVARSGGEDHRAAFEQARGHLATAGGLRPQLIASPPERGAPMPELDSWAQELIRDAEPPSSWEDFPVPSASPVTSDQLVHELISLLAETEPQPNPKVVLSALWASTEVIPA